MQGVPGAAKDRAERRAREQERAAEDEDGAEEQRACRADRNADRSAQRLAGVPALILPERDHQPGRENGESDAERPDIDERAAHDHQPAEHDERDRQRVRRHADHAL